MIDIWDILNEFLEQNGYVKVSVEEVLNDDEVIPDPKHFVEVKSSRGVPFEEGVYGWDKTSPGIDRIFNLVILSPTRIKVITDCLAYSDPTSLDLCDPKSLDKLEELIINP